ncbi:hypothetical protein LCL61_32245 [Amycolatopsis coloradensis]|uniref:Uncharacterized protein n=1 Tax=Amycolatopsis coloradensis TaxID=76021 RepID=A0ACD5BLR5_9PSEU
MGEPERTPKAPRRLLWVVGTPFPSRWGSGELCGLRLLVSVGTDADMTVAAQALRDDPKARRVLTDTKAEASERFKKIFADRPEMLELATPDELRQRIPKAEKATCSIPRGSPLG